MPRILFVGFVLFALNSFSLRAQPPAQASPTPDAERVERDAKSFVSILVNQDYEAAFAQFDATMAKALPVETLRETWEALLGQAGPFKQMEGVRRQAILQYDVVFVTCAFDRATFDVRVVFDKAGKVSGLFFEPSAYTLPPYASPGAYKDTGAYVGAGRWALPATLTLPQRSAGPFPAVVLVHGSGPQDRDETIGPNKPFRDLAVGLGGRGVAVLRYEKRTKAHANLLLPLMAALTVKEETIDDALKAVDVLRQSPDIDADRIYVLGHSLGGSLVPRIAERDPGIAGFIVMAGATRPLEDSILEQFHHIANLDGRIAEDEQAQLDQIGRQAALVKSDELTSRTPAADLPLGVPAAYWLDLRGYEPAKAAATVSAPMLILQGGRDYQVTEDDFEQWKRELSSRAGVEFRHYPNLNHLFVAGDGRAEPSDYLRPGHVDPMVIDDIVEWIQKAD